MLYDLNDQVTFEAAEQAAAMASITELRWLSWCDEVEELFGHALDGGETIEGNFVSLDSAYDAYRAGFTPVEYWQGVRA